MGMITVRIEGSFPHNTHVETRFAAEIGGHAFAIYRAIESLIRLMPSAITLDHRLASQGDKPPRSGFGMAETKPEPEGEKR